LALDFHDPTRILQLAPGRDLDGRLRRKTRGRCERDTGLKRFRHRFAFSGGGITFAVAISFSHALAADAGVDSERPTLAAGGRRGGLGLGPEPARRVWRL
jgi:hypothetical protein